MQIKWKPRRKISLVVDDTQDPPTSPGTTARLNYVHIDDDEIFFYMRWYKGTTGTDYYSSHGLRPAGGGWMPSRFTNMDGSPVLSDHEIRALRRGGAFEVAMILTTVFDEGALHE